MTKYERASQIWAVLAWAAKNRQTLTYNHLSKLIRVPRPGLGQHLAPIQTYCLSDKKEEMPPLTILVIGEKSGLPHEGFYESDITKYPKLYVRVYEYDWLAHVNPGPEGFKNVCERD